MKKNYSGKLLLPLLVVLLLFSCNEKTETTSKEITHQHSEQTKYTCPMHPQIVQDHPGKCPICGMHLVPVSSSNELHIDSSLLPLLKPVNEQIVSSISTIQAEKGSRIFTVPLQGVVTYDTRSQESISSRVGGRIEKMYIKYNYQPVSKGQLIMEIYSPDLAAAQRDLIYISRNDDDASLMKRAEERLSLLGMSAAQINQVIKTGKPLYRVPVYSKVSGYIVEKNAKAGTANSGGAMSLSASAVNDDMNGMGGGEAVATTLPPSAPAPTPILIREGQYVSAGETIFTVYKDNNLVAEFSFTPSLSSEIKSGQKLLYHTVANLGNVKEGNIGLVEPTQRNGTSFSIARVYLSGSDLKPGQLLKAYIPVVKSAAYWLPQKALLQLGTKTVVFKKENGVFIPKQVTSGLRVNGMVEISDEIGDWQIAKSASFLIDNESFIRLTTNNSK